MVIYDFRTLIKMTTKEINEIDFSSYSVNDLCKFDTRTLMQIFREMDLDDIVLVYSVFDDEQKTKILECISPFSGKIVKEKSDLFQIEKLTEEQKININSIIQEVLKEKCKNFLNGQEDVLFLSQNFTKTDEYE